MSDKKKREELSAYLDGEAKQPEKVEKLLREDPVAAQHYEELAKLSAHVKKLAPPRVDPAFATRVMARVSEEGTAPGRLSRWYSVAAPVAAAALLVLILGGIWFATRSAVPEAPGPQIAGPTEKQLEEMIEKRLRDGEAFPPNDDLEFAVAGLATGFSGYTHYMADADVQDLAIVVDPEDAELLDGMAEVLAAGAELNAILGELNEEETEVFRILLREYVTEG